MTEEKGTGRSGLPKKNWSAFVAWWLVIILPVFLLGFFWLHSRTMVDVWHFEMDPVAELEVSLYFSDGCLRMIADQGHSLGIGTATAGNGFSSLPADRDPDSVWPWGNIKFVPASSRPHGGTFVSLPIWILVVSWISVVAGYGWWHWRKQRSS